DVQMPGADGFELCRQLQLDPALRHVPLVLMTEESGGTEMQRFARDVGAVAMLMKPVTPQVLRAVADVWLFSGFVPDATQKLRRLSNEDFHSRHSKELVAQLETKVADLERLSRRYKLRSETNRAIVHLRSREELLRAICRIAVEHGGVRLAAIVPADRAERHPRLVDSYRAAAGSATQIDDALDEFANAGRGLSAKAMRSGKPVVVNDIFNDPTTASLHESARRAGIGAMAVCPLRQGGEAFGALEIYACTAGFFGPDILRMFEAMAEDIAFGLHNHAREADHEVALQRTADALEYNRVLMESSPIGIIAYDAAGSVVSVNAAAAKLIGGTVTQLASQNFHHLESWKASGLLRLAEQALPPIVPPTRKFMSGPRRTGKKFGSGHVSFLSNFAQSGICWPCWRILASATQRSRRWQKPKTRIECWSSSNRWSASFW
ncbi:MAG: GAF domain-containing protein, partial [Steroidobacteraceae bacterium]